MKKAQTMTWPVIIGAVLALLVLGAMAYLFVSRGVNPFSRSTQACSERGGVCIDLKGKSCQEVDPSHPIHGFNSCFVADKLEKEYTCCFGVK